MASVISSMPAQARNVYVANIDSDSVSVIDAPSDLIVGGEIPVGVDPFAVAITPDGSRAYVPNSGPPLDPAADTVSVIATATNSAVGSPITVGNLPRSIAITPDGSHAYVPNLGSNNVSVIDTATNTTVGAPIPVGPGSAPTAIAITPDGSQAYVARNGPDNLARISTATNTLLGGAIPVGASPRAIAITPDGGRVYVVNGGDGTVSVIDARNNAPAAPPIPIGANGSGLAITPDGSRVYVTRGGPDDVVVIDTATNTLVGAPIPTGGIAPTSVAITPDGTRAYVPIVVPNAVQVIDTVTNTAVGAPIPVGFGSNGLAITPNQPAVAAFSSSPGTAGLPTAFDAGGASDPDGTVARYDWDFGDGTTLPDGGATPTHAYARSGTYTVSLRITDNEGCSLTQVFTGQTALCNGSAVARTRGQATVGPPDREPPDLALSGPKSQRLDGAVEVTVSCDEPCAATAGGRLLVSTPGGGGKSRRKQQSFKLVPVAADLGAGVKSKLKLKLPKGARKAASAALAADGTVVARTSVAALDQSGNSASAKRTIALRARGGK